MVAGSRWLVLLIFNQLCKDVALDTGKWIGVSVCFGNFSQSAVLSLPK